jgi:hypothetical protein
LVALCGTQDLQKSTVLNKYQKYPKQVELFKLEVASTCNGMLPHMPGRPHMQMDLT